MPLNMTQLFEKMAELDASDLHLKAGTVPIFRVRGELVLLDFPIVSKEEIKGLTDKIIPEKLKENFKNDGAVDFAFSTDKDTRFRTNAFLQKGNISISLRRLVSKNLNFDELNLPKVFYDLCKLKRGLILITGPTGTGKSTTMAALVDYINETRKEHIVTIEDPIEFLFKDRQSIIEQRELGLDAFSFEVALKHALRQDPDVIVLGEMRDRDTINMAIRAAQTGHLVVSTLHTVNAVQTVARILKYFSVEEAEGIREDLAGSLAAVISQRLLPSADGKSRVPAVEVMVVDMIIKKLIRENRIEDMQQIIRNGELGMQTFDMSLAALVNSKLITFDAGKEYADDYPTYKRYCDGVEVGSDRKGLIGNY